jgi:putative oxidoreductase
MSDMPNILGALIPWVGLALLGLIFMANAVGVVDQSIAVNELAATGMPRRAAKRMVAAGRLVQLVATPCLFIHSTRLVAALLLTLFLIGATLTAHAFWRRSFTPADRNRHLANFLKNVAIMGGLLLAATWRT